MLCDLLQDAETALEDGLVELGFHGLVVLGAAEALEEGDCGFVVGDEHWSGVVGYYVGLGRIMEQLSRAFVQ